VRTLSAVILFLVAPHAAAAMDCADQTQLGLNKCADAEFQRADKALNDSYRAALGRLAGDDYAKQRQLLRVAEQAWVAFRDAECRFAVSSTENGSIYPMENLICLTEETLKRTRTIDSYLHCEEGDLSCPVPRP
jgi:uncharacterized protein YecT (DUF1311 family)